MTRQQRLVLFVAILASFVAFLDIAVVNVALPAIRNEFGGGIATQQWIVDAYLITLGSLMLVAGSISDLFGRQRVLTIGIIGFALTSLLCAIAPNNGFLIASRSIQGISGALLVPSSLALVVANFSGKLQARAIGIWTAWSGTIAFIIGPLVGGLLVDHLSWRMVFGINVLPVGVTLWLIRRLNLQEHRQHDVKVDWPGAILCALGLGSSVFALIEQPHYGWHNPLISLPLLGGLILFGSFLLYESRTPQPMLPLRLFRRRNFSVGNMATMLVYAGLTATTFLLIVFIQQVGGYSAFASGFALIPVTILMFSLSARWGTLAGKYGPRLFMAVGPLLMATGLFLINSLISKDIVYFKHVLPGLIVFGTGLSITVAPLTAAILGDVDPQHAGIGSAINNAIARVAGLIAVAVVGSVVAVSYRGALISAAQTSPIGQRDQSFITRAQERPLDTSVPNDQTIDDRPTVTSLLNKASVRAFRSGLMTCLGLIACGGLVSAIGITNKRA